MQEMPRLVKIKGNSLVILIWTAVYLAAFLLALSFAVMGTAFSWLFIVLLLLALPLLLVSFLVVAALNRFVFDDESRCLVKALGSRVPYDKIKAIHVRDRWGRSSISVRTGWVKRRWLADGLNKHDAALALAEFSRRFPEDAIHRKTYSPGVLALAVVVIASVFTASYAGFLYYLSRKEPAIRLERKTLSSAATAPRKSARFEVDGFSFLLPKKYKEVKGRETGRAFEDEQGRTRLQAVPGESEAQFSKDNLALQLITGVRTDFELYRLTLTSRYGIIPTLLKTYAGRDLHGIRAYEFERGSLSGFILEGTKDNDGYADILVADGPTKREMHFFLRQQGALDEAFVDALLNSLAAGGKISEEKPQTDKNKSRNQGRFRAKTERTTSQP